MRPMLTKTFLTCASVFGLLFAQSSDAVVVISLDPSTTGPLNVGDTFDVDVLASWDGSGALTSIFSSHAWSNQLALINAEFPPATQFETRPVLFAGGAYDPGMSRFGTIADGQPGDDLSQTARTVQYGSLDPLNSTNAATDQVVTQLTFEVIGEGDGVAEIFGALLQGDAGATADDFAFGPDVAITIPEPGGVLLGLSSLASVLAVAAVRRRA
jgi:hypothetical protein